MWVSTDAELRMEGKQPSEGAADMSKILSLELSPRFILSGMIDLAVI